MRSVDDIGDELYALPPPMFTAARDAAVAQARTEGDVATARQLATLKRPTQSAYLVNLLALRRPDVVTELIDHLHDGANAAECDVDVTTAVMFRGYRVRPSAPQLIAAEAALHACGYVPRRIASGGGSDAKTPWYSSISAVEIRRSRPSDGRLRSVPSNAIVVEPPLSSAMPVTAPRRTSACASSKFVSPTL